MLPIPVYIGLSERFRVVQGLTETSIRINTELPDDAYEIHHVVPIPEEGCTGFTNVRYTIEHGIYLDCDMIVLGDIEDLWRFRVPGKYVCLDDGSSEVGVIDSCTHECRNKVDEKIGKLPKHAVIPADIWNVEDRLTDEAKLVHFTNLDTQPWFNDDRHPDPGAETLWQVYKSLVEEYADG